MSRQCAASIGGHALLCGLVCAALTVGCGDQPRTLSWYAEIPEAVRTESAAIEATILPGRCGVDLCPIGTPLYRESASVGGAAPEPPLLTPGDYAFVMRVRDADCNVIACGCADAALPSDDGAEVTVTVAVGVGGGGCAGRCTGGICAPGDASVDGGEDACVTGLDLCNLLDDDCDGTVDEDCGCSPPGEVGPCTTNCGSTGTHECGGDNRWGDCAPPLESCDGHDSDCDGVADEGFTYTQDIPQVLGDSPVEPDVDLVFAHGRFDVAYLDTDNLIDEDIRPNVYFVAVEEDGSRMGRVGFPVSADPARRPRLAASVSGFGLSFWWPRDCGRSCTRREAFVATLDEFGTMISGPTMLEDNANGSPRPDIAFDGANGFGVVLIDGQLHFEVVGPASEAIGTRIQLAGGASDVSLTHSPSGYTALYSSGTSVMLTQEADRTFPVMGTLIHDAAGAVTSVALEPTPSGFFAAWAANGGAVVQTARLDFEGTPLGGAQTHDIPGSTISSARPDIAVAEGQLFIVIDADDDVYFARLRPDGTELQPFTALPDLERQADPAIAWGTERLGVVFTNVDVRPDPTGEGDFQMSDVIFTTVSCE